MKPLLIIKTGRAIKGVPAELLDFEHWTAEAAGIPLEQCKTVTVIDGEALPEVTSCSGVVVTGSAAMVTDKLQWSEATAAWLQKAISAEVPILGICYGHQLLAQALGGVVDYHPRGREMGTKIINLAAAANEDLLFKDLPAQFFAHVTHMQSVMRLPVGAEVLAWNSFEAHHAVRFAPKVWGVQFHPEFTVSAMRHYLHLRSEALNKEGMNAAELLAAVAETEQARAVLQRFVRLVGFPK